MIVLDTCVILRYALDERGAEQVKIVFDNLKRGKEKAIIPATVLLEIVAIVSKRGLKEIAFEIEEFLIDVLRVRIEPITRDLAIIGGLLKAKYSLIRKTFSYNDALIIALAIQNSASIYSFDPEFTEVEEVKVITSS